MTGFVENRPLDKNYPSDRPDMINRPPRQTRKQRKPTK